MSRPPPPRAMAVTLDLRVWGAVEDQLIEIKTERGPAEGGLQIDGLPAQRRRPVADRVRAALVATGLLAEVPTTVLRFEPSVCDQVGVQLDLPIALAVLGRAGRFAGVRWVFASGRLGLDGRVFAENLEKSLSIVTVVTELGWRAA